MSREARPFAPRTVVVIGMASIGLAVCIGSAGLLASQDHLNGLPAVLGVAAVGLALGGDLLPGGPRYISWSFLVDMPAAAFLDPASAFATSVIGELTGGRVARIRPQPLLISSSPTPFPHSLPGRPPGPAPTITMRSRSTSSGTGLRSSHSLSDG